MRSLGLTDSWEFWWETNKFDFIRLRRIQDAPYTGQGRQPETAEERRDRLAHVDTVLRRDVMPLIRELTKADDPSVRASAVVALGKLKDSESALHARRLLQDSQLEVRWSAMLSLGVQEAGQASYFLMNIADDSPIGRKLLDASTVSDELRGVALIAATIRDDGDTEPLLGRLLAQPHDLPNELLTAACEAAGLRRSIRCLAPLTRIAVDESHPEFVRSAATSALGRIGDPAVIPTLLSLLDSGLEPKRAATLALGFVGHASLTSVTDRLVQLLTNDSDAPTRHFAAIALGRIGGDAARGALEASWKDPSSDMKPWLALGLGISERNDPRGHLTGQLVERLRDESNIEHRGAYLIALGLAGGDAALDALARALQAGPIQVSGHAALALGLTGHSEAVAVLREAVRTHSSPAVLRQVALGLGVLGNGSAIPELLDLIRTTNNPFVASFAALGIAFMGDENAIGPLLRVIEQKGPGGVATTFAVAAVGQLFDTDRRPALSRLAAGDNYLSRSASASDLLSLGF